MCRCMYSYHMCIHIYTSSSERGISVSLLDTLRKCIYIYVCICIYILTYMCPYNRPRTPTYLYVYVCIYLHACTPITYIYIYIYIYMYTQPVVKEGSLRLDAIPSENSPPSVWECYKTQIVPTVVYGKYEYMCVCVVCVCVVCLSVGVLYDSDSAHCCVWKV